MTELVFKGKEFVYNHHLAVPHRPLVPDAGKSIGNPRLDGNLIIHGDNLHALKALLPMYAGKVDCIFIDPPYNTGNEGWCYSDNVTAPMIKEWLASNPVGVDDGLRHDKWCTMMWPRLRLLHELLAETGSFWMTIDDNEAHRAKLMLDEVFGEANFVANVVWQKKHTRSNDARWFSDNHDHILVYAVDKTGWQRNLLERSQTDDDLWTNEDNDPRGVWASGPCHAKTFNPKDVYEINSPSGRAIMPPNGTSWRFSESKFQKLVADNRIYFGKTGNNIPRYKRFQTEIQDGLVPVTLWQHTEVGHNQDSQKEISDIGFSGKFDTPKPTRLLGRILELATKPDSLVLDSFAGSGTTAHAVLQANKRDGGNRRFILVEMEDYADNVTAERVRRVMGGYDFTGTQRTELLRKKLLWTTLKNADELTNEVASIENLHDHKYDKISKTVKNGELIVTGETQITDRANGLGGEFTYCTLGEPFEIAKILNGENLPEYISLATVLFHMATNQVLDTEAVQALEGKKRLHEFHVGSTDTHHIWLIYQPDLEWLKSHAAALTFDRAHEFSAIDPTKTHLVFAAARYVSSKVLREYNLSVEFVPLPYCLYRIDKSE